MSTAHIVWNQNPILLDLGYYQLHYYSLFFAVGILCGFLMIRLKFEKQNIDFDLLQKLTIYSILGIIIGARLGHVLFYNLDYYFFHPLEIVLPFRFEPKFEFTGYNGLASHGGAVGLIFAIFLFSNRYKINYLNLLDMFALAAPLCGGFIRIGNFFNSEILGKPTDVSWAIIFKQIDNVPRHPVQLYEAGIYFILFFIMILLKHIKLKLKYGVLFSVFLILLFSSRFLIENLKVHQSNLLEHFILNMGQLLSIPFIILGIVMLINLSMKHKTFEDNSYNSLF